MITDEMVKAYKDAFGAEIERWTASPDHADPCFEASRRGLEAALAAMPQPVAPNEAIDRFRRQVIVALKYAVDEKPKDEKFLPSVFELQVYHLRDIFEEVASSLASPVQGAPAVKSLEWVDNQHGSYALGSGFHYSVFGGRMANFGKYQWQRAGEHKSGWEFGTLDAAKAAAQADFERRIRSCLTDAPAVSEEDDLVAAREAVAEVFEANGWHIDAKEARAGHIDKMSYVRSAFLALRNSRARLTGAK